MRRYLKAALVVAAVGAAVGLVGSALWQWVPGESATAPQLSPGAERVTVDVRNAGGIHGMARVATDRLRGAGFDVVGMGNAPRFDQEHSVVIDRVGDMQTAAAVAEKLGIRRVISEPDSNLFVDVTVRLGADWNGETGSTDEVADSASDRTLVGWLRGHTRSR